MKYLYHCTAQNIFKQVKSFKLTFLPLVVEPTVTYQVRSTMQIPGIICIWIGYFVHHVFTFYCEASTIFG